MLSQHSIYELERFPKWTQVIPAVATGATIVASSSRCTSMRIVVCCTNSDEFWCNRDNVSKLLSVNRLCVSFDFGAYML